MRRWAKAGSLRLAAGFPCGCVRLREVPSDELGTRRAHEQDGQLDGPRPHSRRDPTPTTITSTSCRARWAHVRPPDGELLINELASTRVAALPPAVGRLSPRAPLESPGARTDLHHRVMR